MKRSLVSFLLILIVLFNSNTVFADDNATGGDGEVTTATRAFYRYSEYMYKVSVYVGLSNLVNTQSPIWDYQMIGNAPIYVKPTLFSTPSNLFYGLYSKSDILAGNSFTAINDAKIFTDNPPPIPITNGGSVSALKSYFGDTNTLNILINQFADQRGTTREGLVQNITFNINGVSQQLPPDQVLPVAVDGKYKNKVPWVVIYEPVIIAYLKDNKTKLAFTATEYALAQKLGYFNFKHSSNGEDIASMTEENLPNSVVLESEWFGYKPYSPLDPGVKWSLDRIIQGGGWGMRFLSSYGSGYDDEMNYGSNDTFDYTYRTDTDVISSVWVHSNDPAVFITPDDRAYVTFTVNGVAFTKEVYMPGGSGQLVFFRWHTPDTPGVINIDVQVTGNNTAVLDSGSRSGSISANVVELVENTPPNPLVHDTAPEDFEIQDVPYKPNRSTATWGEWTAKWIPNWVWSAIPEWVPKWVLQAGWWIDKGSWELLGKGEWVDKGYWELTWNVYTATASILFSIDPDERVPTARRATEKDPWTMKSGYGINETIEPGYSTNAPDGQVTKIQNVISYYPESVSYTHLTLPTSDLV